MKAISPLSLATYSPLVNDLLVGYLRLPEFPAKLRLLRWLVRFLGERRRFIAPTVWGFHMLADDTDLIQRCVLFTGDWEPETSSVFASEIRVQDVVYDIGANVGFHSLLAERCGADVVVAFDPDPINGAQFEENLRVNGVNPSKVNFVPKAVSNSEGKQLFRTAPSANMGIGALSRTQGDGMIEVEVVMIDNFIAKTRFPQPTIMKIDVEGWEYEVLRGAKATLSNPELRVILFESDCASDGELSSQEIALLLSDSGFQWERIGPHDTKGNYLARRRSASGMV